MSSPQENSPRNSAAPTRQSAPAPLRGRQTSFISSLRTLPTQRTAAPLSSENSNGLTPLAPQGSQVFEAPPSLRATTSMSSPTSETTRASRGMVDDSFRRSTSRDQGDFVAPDPSLPPSLTRRDKSATFTGDPSDATLGGCDSDVMVAGGGVLSAEEVPGTEPLNRAEDEGAEGLSTDLTSSWEIFLTVGVRLPSDIADKYSQIFFDNELPPPNRRDVLLHGIDHEILTSIGVRIAGHRARIIAACRSLGYTICSRHGCVGCSKESCRGEVAPEIASTSHRNISSGRHQQLSQQQQQHSRKHHHVQDPHRVHFDAKGEDKGHSGSYNDERESRRMFPVIYRAHSNEVVGDDVDEDDQEVHPSVLRLDQQQQHSNTFMGQEVQSEEGGSFSSDQRAGQGDHSHGDVHGGGGFRPHHHHHHGEDLKEPLIPAASPASGEYSFHGSAPRHAGGNGGHPIVDDYQVHEFVFQSSGPHGYTWIDLVGRDHKRTVFQDHLQRIVNTHGFAEPLLLDIDLTLALPQLISCPNEPDQYLIIVRVAAESSGGIEEDSLHLLTHRVMIAVHLGTRTIVTIHRKDSSLMATLRDTWDASMSDKSMSALLCRFLDDGLLSYVDAIHDSESLLDEYEALMLKHSVGGGSNKSAAAAQSSAPRQSLVHLASNASFNGSFDQSAANSAHKSKWSFSKLWGLLCCSDNYPPQQGRLRSGTNFNNTNSNSNMNNAGGVSGMMRLRNKEYQEEMSESNSFSRQRMNQLLYHLHRRCSVYNRMLTLTQTTLEVSYSSLHLASPEYAEQVGRSCGELAMKAETLHDNCQNLLNLHLSLVSFRTNELMNLLTVYSAIFIPITFVCSVYGMNFVNMPELQIYYGYYYCWAFMLFIVLCIVLWFRRKGFL